MANSIERFPIGSGISSQSTPSSYASQKTTTPQPPSPENTATKTAQPSIANPPRQLQRRSLFYQGLIWGTTFSLTAAISAALGATVALVSPFSVNLVPFLQKASLPWGKAAVNQQSWDSLLPYHLSRPVNILVMGVDRVLDAPKGSAESFAGRSDTLLLLRFDPSDRSVRVLSIPRDSRVEVPKAGMRKINDANVLGGPSLAARVISKTLNNVPIDRYVRVTTDAFRELVDLVGGVEVFVPEPMSYRDVTQNLDINLEAGWQTLNGQQAEEFARFRSDGKGDIGRVQRQQTLLKALQNRLYSPAMLARIPQAMHILQQYLDTNLSLEELLALANFGRDLERDNIKMVMLPGRFSQEGEYDDKSYWIINPAGRDRVMGEYFALNPNPEADPSTQRDSLHRIRIAIQNATDDPGLGNQLVDYLAKQDFHRAYVIKESPQVLGETEIVAQQGDLQAASSLKNVLGVGRVEASSTGDLDSDLTIRIGMDAKQILAGNSFLKVSQPR
jgi:LCP family protein required for cell wall assembly